MEFDKLFKLETKEEHLRMKAIYRYLRAQGKTPESIFNEYLNDDEKRVLKELESRIITESIKPFLEADINKKRSDDSPKKKTKKGSTGGSK